MTVRNDSPSPHFVYYRCPFRQYRQRESSVLIELKNQIEVCGETRALGAGGLDGSEELLVVMLI